MLKEKRFSLITDALVLSVSVVLTLLWALCSGKDLINSALSAGAGFAAFFIPQLCFELALHRHDRLKATAASTLYDAVYAMVLKYMVLILILGFCFIFLHLNAPILIIVFVFSVIVRLISKEFIFERSEQLSFIDIKKK